MRKQFLITKLLWLVIFAAGCSVADKTQPIYVADDSSVIYGENIQGRAAPIPEGTLRYCWEEPMVDLEQNGPGLDPGGKWYHPSYVAGREVRQGKWRPCIRPEKVKN